MPISTKGQADETVHRNRGRRRDEDARKRILDAALEMLEEFGFAGTTTDDIAERAGTGKATVYRWWPNKAAVVIEALREFIVQEVPVPDTGDIYEDIRLQLRNCVKQLAGRRGRIFKAFMVAAQHDPDLAEAFQTLWRRPWRRAAKSVLERQRRKDVRDTADLDAALDVMYGPLYYRLFVSASAPGGDYTDALTDIIVRGILKR